MTSLLVDMTCLKLSVADRGYGGWNLRTLLQAAGQGRCLVKGDDDFCVPAPRSILF